MAPPANKRRKLQHASEGEDDDASSFASFGTSADDNDVEEEDPSDVDGDAMEVLNGVDEDMEDEDDTSGEEEAAIPLAKMPSKATPTKDPAALRKRPGEMQAFTSGNFKSNMFKMQVDELLEQIRSKQGKRERAAEDALHELKSTIERIPARSPLPVEDAEKQLLKKDKVAGPFPSPRPPRDAKYKLEYRKPANVNVAGSYALKTATRAKDALQIDMVLAMPTAMFQEKDFLNYRCFYKRAYYLACVAAGLKEAHGGQHEVRFAEFHDNPLQPIIAVEPLEKDSKTHWRINILACVSADAFSADKLQLERNCLRGISDSQDTNEVPTPFYNSSLRADMVVTPYLKLLHSASKTCDAFQDACLLGSTWLRQRGLGSDSHIGGFGNFEWDALMALMLSGGGPTGTPILSTGYSSYQLFKATLQVLAMKDFSKQPLVIGDTDYTPRTLSDGTPVVWDAGRSHNLMYRLTPWSYRNLKRDARTTLSMLGDQEYDGFDATFILRSDGLPYKYDCIVNVPLDSAVKAKQDHDPLAKEQNLYKALRKGLGDRVSQVNIIPPKALSWDVGSRRPASGTGETTRIGLIVNAENVGRTVDHGPSAEEKKEAAEFRKFWGEKAELRRFKDGSIMESLVWSANEDGPSVLEQVVRYLILKHVGEEIEAGVTFRGDSAKSMLPRGNATAAFHALAEAYKQMENDIRGLEGLPLSIRQIMPADAQLRSASPSMPLTGSRPMPADVVIQFEGSGRWPDDLVAIQRTKIAFLLKLSELLQESVNAVAAARIGLENQEHDTLNQAYLDIIYDTGAAFRMRIYHDREQTLLERQLKDKALDPRSKEVAALGLAKHKRDYLKAPAHTQAIARLCSRHPALSGTIRLIKKCFASHLLTNHVAPEVIELLVAKTFVQPWAWQTPSSVQTAFLRTLFFLSRWDWRAEPLIVDLSGSGDLKAEDVKAITTKFEAWRKLDPNQNRVVLFAASNVDREGTTWTDGRPARVVAGRITALAKAACAEISDKGLEVDMSGLFASSMGDFDFLLHLDPVLVGRKKRKVSKSAGFKNLEMEVMSDSSLTGYDPVSDFLRELETVFGAAVVFFSGAPEVPVIAGLWNPQTKERPWKLNLAYSTVLKMVSGGEDGPVKAEVNKGGILAEIARLGGDIIEKVEVNR